MGVQRYRASSFRVLHSVLCDHAGYSIQFLPRNSRTLATEQRCDHVFCRALEKSIDEVAKGGTPRNVTWHSRNIDVPRAVLFMSCVALFLKNPQLSAHGRIAWFVRELVTHLCNGCPLQSIENIHNLAFAARKSIELQVFHDRALVF